MWRLFRSQASESEAKVDESFPPEPESPQASDRVLNLQRTLGNQALQRMIGAKNDESQHEAQTQEQDEYPSIDTGAGAPLAEDVRQDMESRFDEGLGEVRIHSDPQSADLAESLNAEAFTSGRDVYFAAGKYAPNTPSGQRLLAHELTHTLQQNSGGPSSRSPVSQPTDAAETEATAISERMTTQPGARLAPKESTSARISLEPSPAPPTAKGTTMYWPGTEPKAPPPTHVFEDAAAWTAAGAPAALDAYWKLVPGNRKSAFDFSYPKGNVAKVLKALSSDAAAGAYQAHVRELLLWVEEAETRLASGKKDDEMADIEAKFVYEKNKKEVEAQSGKQATQAEVEASRQAQVSQKSFHHPAAKSRWEKLSPEKRGEWTKKANDAIADVVAHAAKTHPALKLDASMFKLAFHEIDKNSPGALAQGGQVGGKRVCSVGFEFVDAVKANPAYALSTVIHELFGHVEFNDPGQVATYQQALFSKAGAKIPGYTSDPTAERASYGYHESEIYSLLRELPYWTPVSAKDKGIERLNPDPKMLVAYQIDNIKDEWEPTLAVALMRGLYKRFSLDPRIEKTALTAFEGVVRGKFTAAEATQILK
jgi:hypothetical protein